MSTPSSQQDNEITSPTKTMTTCRTNAVPLIVPRYQKKQRSHNQMEITDSSGDILSITKALQEHTKETLSIRNGPVRYEEKMFFHPYGLFKHGRRQIHSRSVGYSGEYDLVITREAISEPSDIDLGLVRRCSELDKPICLDPKARRPMTDGELGKKLRLNAPRYRKYPGIRAPKNRKERNRLLNDYFSTEHARKILEKYRERHANGEGSEDLSPPIRPAFGKLPSVFYDIIDLDEDVQTRTLEKCGVQLHPTATYTVRDPDSGESRFQSLNSRLRGELIHALNSDFLSRQIDDLERAFSRFIVEGKKNKPLIYHFRDGYGRLVCHGVAAYYLLVSESEFQPDGTKITVVNWPRKKKNDCNPLNLPKSSLMSLLQRKQCDMGDFSSPSTAQSTPIQQVEEASKTPVPFSLDETPDISASFTGLLQVPQRASSGDDLDNRSVSVYEPGPTGPSRGDGMTATQKKKMRRALRAAQLDAGDKKEETCT